jgi:D-alanyl-D-alanine carboxypeptidase
VASDARALTLVTSLTVALAIAAASATSALATSSHATPPTLHRPTYTRELQKLADRYSGAVAIVVTPGGTWKGAAGWADSPAKRRADPDDRFAIESTTKTFVATVVLQLVGERRLDLHDTVQHWLPGLFPARPPITVRQLLSHSSGLPPDLSLGQPLRTRVEAIAAGGILFRPGTSTAYSNGNYVLLGLIVEKVTGRRLDRVVTDRIIRPLHLDGTSYGTEHAKRQAPWLGYPEFFATPVSGDGGIISTAGDVATFFRALMSGKVIRNELLSEMTHTVRTDDPGLRIGLGIFRKRFSCGVAWGHGGDLGYSVDVAVARDGSKAVVVARNNPNAGDGEKVKERLYCT